jgi:hypothetical protein
MALRLMDFNYTIIHRPGAYNIADYLSRNTIQSEESDFLEKETEYYVAFISEHAVPKAFTRNEIIEETKKDQALVELIKLVEGDHETQSRNKENHQAETNIFAKVLEEISITSDGLVMRGNRLIIPETLQEKSIRIAHEGHQGITKTKSLLRTKIWFPGMDKKVEEIIAKCLACELNDTSSYAQPIKRTKLPAKAWLELAMDFFGPIPNGNELLVLMDKFSRMPVVEEVKTTAADFVLPKLDTIFSLLGIPEDLETDNGPPFNGVKFSEFCKYYGINHRKITPYHPPAKITVNNLLIVC